MGPLCLLGFGLAPLMTLPPLWCGRFGMIGLRWTWLTR
jgi:hypothetical protein